MRRVGASGVPRAKRLASARGGEGGGGWGVGGGVGSRHTPACPKVHPDGGRGHAGCDCRPNKGCQGRGVHDRGALRAAFAPLHIRCLGRLLRAHRGWAVVHGVGHAVKHGGGQEHRAQAGVQRCDGPPTGVRGASTNTNVAAPVRFNATAATHTNVAPASATPTAFAAAAAPTAPATELSLPAQTNTMWGTIHGIGYCADGHSSADPGPPGI
jgi:hypothetical protein